MGDGSPEPDPTFCVTLDGDVVGWVDSEGPASHPWLGTDELNLGYGLGPDARGRGVATRSLMLLLHHLALAPPAPVATLTIHPENEWSHGVARRCGFTEHGVVGDNGSRLYKKPVPPVTYTDGVVTIRRPSVDDAEAHTAMIDDAQIDWLWEPEHRGLWEAKTPAEQLEHQRRFLADTAATWGSGPRWWFAVEVAGQYVGHVDVDLRNPHVAPGDANVSYSMAPTHRGRGHVSRAVRLVLRFIAEHTGALEAHIVVHPDNVASLRVARAAGAEERERYVDHHGAPMVRHVLAITR